jgi:hypothetical protein
MGYPLNALGSTLTAQIADIVTGGDGHVPPSPQSFLTWCAPGIPLAPEAFEFAASGLGTGKTAEDEKKLINHAYNWSQLVDFVPDVGAAYSNERQQGMFRPDAQARLSAIYGDILRFAKVVDKELTPAEQAKLERFRNLLSAKKKVKDIITDEETEVTDDSAMLKAYYAKQAAYITAALQYNAKRIAAQSANGKSGKAAVADWSNNAELYRLQVKSAADAWIAAGYRNEVDAINAYINNIGRRNMMSWKQGLVEQYDEAVLNGTAPGQKFHYTTVIPGDFAKSNGWTGYSMSHETSHATSESNSRSWSASGGLSLGIFNIGGQAGGESSKYTGNYELSSFKLSLELCQAIVCRSWFEGAFFQNRGWTLRKGEGWMYESMPSDGNTPPNGPKGQCIGFPTIALFARNIRIESREFVSAYREERNRVGGGGAVSYGPFVLGGTYSSAHGETQLDTEETDQSLTVKGMQLIGFVNHLLPKSPNPLPELKDEDFA